MRASMQGRYHKNTLALHQISLENTYFVLAFSPPAARQPA